MSGGTDKRTRAIFAPDYVGQDPTAMPPALEPIGIRAAGPAEVPLTARSRAPEGDPERRLGAHLSPITRAVAGNAEPAIADLDGRSARRTDVPLGSVVGNELGTALATGRAATDFLMGVTPGSASRHSGRAN